MAVYGNPADLANFGLNTLAAAKITTATKQEALEAASDIVDGYLAGQFVLPLVAWSKDITRATCIIAAYDLLVTRGYNPDAGADPNFRLRYEDIIRWLEKVAANNGVTPRVTDSSPGATVGATTEAPRVSTSSQRGWSSRGCPGGRGGGFVGD